MRGLRRSPQHPPTDARRKVSAVEKTRGVLATALAVSGTIVVSLAAFTGVRAAQERMRRNSAILNETLPVNSKWWRDHARQEGTLLYVAIGDSAAQGIGASAPAHSYVGLIAERMRELTHQSLRVVNLSVSGATTELAARDQLPRFRTLTTDRVTPDLVTVAIGANDIVGFDPAAFEANIREIFGALPAHAIVADLPCFFLPWNERKVAVANRIVRSVAAEHGLEVVPLHETTRRRGLRGILTEFAIDLFHPNDHGYRVWASAFLPAVTAAIATRISPPTSTPSPGETAPAPTLGQ